MNTGFRITGDRERERNCFFFFFRPSRLFTGARGGFKSRRRYSSARRVRVLLNIIPRTDAIVANIQKLEMIRRRRKIGTKIVIPNSVTRIRRALSVEMCPPLPAVHVKPFATRVYLLPGRPCNVIPNKNVRTAPDRYNALFRRSLHRQPRVLSAPFRSVRITRRFLENIQQQPYRVSPNTIIYIYVYNTPILTPIMYYKHL